MKKMSDTLPPFPALEAETKSPTAFKNCTYQNKKSTFKTTSLKLQSQR